MTNFNDCSNVLRVIPGKYKYHFVYLRDHTVRGINDWFDQSGQRAAGIIGPDFLEYNSRVQAALEPGRINEKTRNQVQRMD